MFVNTENFAMQQKIRIVTAASLFDGHDAAINIMRRIMQAKGAEVIHLGHNRSVYEIVEAAIEEDAHGIAITSYQGGHVEFFKYMKDLLAENNCGHIKLFGGGGGTILPQEIDELHAYGISRIYSPDDGRKMGLEGMIEDLLNQCTTVINPNNAIDKPLGKAKNIAAIAHQITEAENGIVPQSNTESGSVIFGITGTGGAGKSSVTDEIVRRYLHNFQDKTIAIISVDPSKKKTGGALLGDRIRMNSISNNRCYMRSMATRNDNLALSEHVQAALNICKAQNFDLIILESAGTGQSDAGITDYADISMYVMTPEYGAASQLEKINMLDYADIICINKCDKTGPLDTIADVKKQCRLIHNLFMAPDEQIPVIGTVASQFNNDGMNQLFKKIVTTIQERKGINFGNIEEVPTAKVSNAVIPPSRIRYLSEISSSVRRYNNWTNEQAELANKLYCLKESINLVND